MGRANEQTGLYRTAVCKLAARLMAGPATYDELCEASGMLRSTVTAWVRSLRATPHPMARDPAVRVVRVCGYDKCDSGRAIKLVFEWNTDAKHDLAKPKPKKPAERSAAYRDRSKIATLTSALRSWGNGAQCQHTDTVANEGA